MTKNSDQNGKSKETSIVVVGVDGSSGSRAALRWAVAEARLRNSPVLAVHAWTFSYPGGAGYGYLGETLDDFPGGVSNLHRAAEDMIEHAIGGLAAEADGVEIEREIVEGTAAEVLVGAATERDLLVVGSRGHGGFAGLVLGSVSQRCAHHARGPVVIVHAPKPVADRPEPAEALPTSSQVAA